MMMYVADIQYFLHQLFHALLVIMSVLNGHHVQNEHEVVLIIMVVAQDDHMLLRATTRQV